MSHKYRDGNIIKAYNNEVDLKTKSIKSKKAYSRKGKSKPNLKDYK